MKIVILLLLTFIIILFVLLFTKIKINIYKRHSYEAYIEIILFKIFKKRININKIIQDYMAGHSNISNIRNTLTNITIVLNRKAIIKKFLNKINIDKVTFISRFTSTNELIFPYEGSVNWLLISFLKRFLNTTFGHVKNEYYQIYMLADNSNGFDIDITFGIFLYKLIPIILSNYKEIKNLYQNLKKEEKIYGKLKSTS